MDEDEKRRTNVFASPFTRSLRNSSPSPSEHFSVPKTTLHGPPAQDGKPRTMGTAQRLPSRIIVSFGPSDPEHPNNWPTRKKMLVFLGGIMSVINSTLGSSLPSNAIPYITKDFGITNEIQQVLPISTYLIGYVVGPTLCGPLSENFGRRPIMVYSFMLYTVFTMACALAPNWPSLLVFRWLCGMTASAPIAVVGGMYADIYGEPRKRGLAMAWFMAATTFGPCIAPFLSGFIAENTSWRWVFWTGLSLAGATFPIILLMPESYVPILLHQKAAKMRAETGNENIIAKSDLERKSFKFVMKVVMTRPFRMIAHEAIVFFTCIYLALAYGIFYLYFEAYPIIFQGIYHMSPGISGLAFLPIGIGAAACAIIFLWYDSYLAEAQKRKAPWSQIEEYRRLPLACVGGPMYVVSLFWVGWSAYANVHWIVPMLSGITFGMGFLLIFMAMLNYISDAYLTYAASAQGIASACRSIFGATLPLAAHQMFTTLGIHWACSLLAFLSMGMAIIPFAFIKYGDRIRANSKFCQELRALQEKEAQEHKEESEASTPTTVEKAYEKMFITPTKAGLQSLSANTPSLRNLIVTAKLTFTRWKYQTPNSERGQHLSMAQRTTTTHLTQFTRPAPNEVTYDLSQPDLVTITLPAHSTWSSGLHWHESHDEFLEVVQGRILVTLGRITREYGSDDGVVKVPKGIAHEWRRIPKDPSEDNAVVRERTVPADGQKEVFFRMLNSFLMEPEPQKLHRPLYWPERSFEGVVEAWVVELQLFAIFRDCDNFPVMIGSEAGWVGWVVTHVILFFSSWLAWYLGLRGIYSAYVGDNLKQTEQKVKP